MYSIYNGKNITRVLSVLWDRIVEGNLRESLFPSAVRFCLWES